MITVVVLLILAGVTVTLMFGENNIFKLAKEAGDKTNEAIKSEQSQIDELNKWLTENGWSSENGGGSGENPDTPKVLEVGSTVLYNPSGTYNWQAKYCSSTKTEGTDDVTLNSSTGQNFNISTWKVLSIDETTKKVELVPTAPTTGAVYLGQAQGYNNGVKLLNDACSSLYGNEEKGIIARSIKIEDIEYYMTEEAKTGENGAYKYASDDDITYGTKADNAYEICYYPVIYAQEIKAVIGDEVEKTTGLGLSDSLANFIERSEGTSTTSNIGAITTATSIRPYQTYWTKDATFMATAFDEHTKKDNTKVNYYSLIMPQATSTTYWVASRCVNSFSNYCRFGVRLVSLGCVSSYDVYISGTGEYNDYLALFPVVTLSSELLKPGTETDFTVQL